MSAPVRMRLAGFGDAAVERLVALLASPDRYVQDSVGLTLTEFAKVDPRHLPALVDAWRGGNLRAGKRGNGWIARPIGATRTEEALRLLWEDFQRGSSSGSRNQTDAALARFGVERVRPLILRGLAECREHPGEHACSRLLSLLRDIEEPIPAWSRDAVAAIALTAASQEARRGAEFALVRLRDPLGLTLSRRRLAALAAPAGRNDAFYEVRSLIGDIAAYGPAARDAGPLIARYLHPSYHADLRATAALAAGGIGDTSSVRALMALQPELTDDWLIAYNAAESLGRLRAAEARPLLERLRRGHWHRGVRHNAERALQAIAGGAFARKGIASDPQPYLVAKGADGEEYVYFGDLRYAADEATRCRPDGIPRRRVPTDDLADLPWPESGAAEIVFEAPSDARAGQIRARISETQAAGRLQSAIRVRGGHLIAFNGGEFGGGLLFLPESGSARSLLHAPVQFMWRMGGRLYVATGIAHGVLDSGDVAVVDPDRLTVERTIRLPAHPDRLLAVGGSSVVVGTAAGAVGISVDGTLHEAGAHAFCGSSMR